MNTWRVGASTQTPGGDGLHEWDVPIKEEADGPSTISECLQLLHSFPEVFLDDVYAQCPDEQTVPDNYGEVKGQCCMRVTALY